METVATAQAESTTLTKEAAVPASGVSAASFHRQRNTAGSFHVLLGFVYVFAFFFYRLYNVPTKFQDMRDAFDPIMTTSSMNDLDAKLDMFNAMSNELGTSVLPALAQSFNMTMPDFQMFLATNFSDVATGAQQLPAIITQFRFIVGSLRDQLQLFGSASRIPWHNGPVGWVIPAGFGWAAAVVVALGIAIILCRDRKTARNRALVSAFTAVVYLCFAFGLRWEPYSADADQMNNNLDPIYTPQLVAGAKGAMNIVTAMGNQMTTQMFPLLMAHFGMTQQQLNQYFGANFPATAQALGGMETALGTFQGVVTTFDEQYDNYDSIKDVKFHQVILIWIFGAALQLLACVWLAYLCHISAEPVSATLNKSSSATNVGAATSLV